MGTTLLAAPHRSSAPSARRARSDPAVAAALLVLGVVATGAGAGLAVRHLQKEGLSPTSALGLALVALGLAALVTGTRPARRRLRRWYRLLVVPLVVVLLVPVSSLGLAVAFTWLPETRLGDGTPADHGLSSTDVAFRTADGAELSGWVVPTRNGAGVVLLHGAGSTRTATLRHAAVLADQGFGVLLYDARGHGRSGGTGTDLGWSGDEDVAAAVTALLQQPGIRPGAVGLVGLSMGGEQAVGAAAADPRIAAVVAEGATARTAEDKAHWLPGGVAGAVQRGLDRLTFGLTDLLTPASPPTSLRVAVARAERTPFLLVAAGRVPDEARAAEVLRQAAPERVQVWEVPGAGHTDGLDVDPDGWTSRVTAFLTAALLG